MKSLPRYLGTVLYILGTPSLLGAAELPTTVQFDVVFPKNNTAYQPVYPFPVVFGLHNGSAAWSYVLTWEWTIIALDQDGVTGNTIANGGWWPGVPGIEKPAPPPDEYLIIDPVNELLNTTARRLVMAITFGIHRSCNETLGDVSPERETDVTFRDQIFFSLDPENGVVPDITAGGPCATPVGSIGIIKDIPNIHGPCPILAPGPQPTKSCALSVNETVASQVAARMIQHAECPDQTWPNVTGLMQKCKPKTSGQAKLWSDASLHVYLTVVTCFVAFSLLGL